MEFPRSNLPKKFKSGMNGVVVTESQDPEFTVGMIIPAPSEQPVLDESGKQVEPGGQNRHWAEYEKWLAAGNTPEPELSESDLPQLIKSKQIRLNSELQQYIQQHYDLGTQMSLQALYSNPDTPLPVKSSLMTVWAWIQQILGYYYKVKSALADCKTIAQLEAVTYNFAQFDSTDPGVVLKDLVVAKQKTQLGLANVEV